MALDIDFVTVDSHDPEKLAHFWQELLGFELRYDSATDPDAASDSIDSEREILIQAPKGRRPQARVLFIEVHDEKQVKNRLHFDLRPEEDQAGWVAKAESLGARRVDIGQGDDKPWVVMADPEGNEFCILRDRAAVESESS
jgi:catechol 2,3-dioxygenase-like lactoylglutathione lyase family enzyme